MKLKTTLALSIFPLAAAQPALADDDHNFKAHLVGVEEVPSISTGASGELKAQVNNNETAIDWELSYKDLEGGEVQQAHIHFAQRGVNGGITVFLCTNLGNGPTGIQACPPPPATITGTIMAADVSPDIKATEMARTQGINTGEFNELLRALRAGATYANVHSKIWPAGEVRGQIDQLGGPGQN
jgi:CHRD domain